MKALLRYAGIEPPKWHAVGGTVRDHRERFPPLSIVDLDRLVSVSAWLRKERETSLYGDIDFIPTEQYDEEAGRRAKDDATFVLQVVQRVIETMEAPQGPEKPEHS